MAIDTGILPESLEGSFFENPDLSFQPATSTATDIINMVPNMSFSAGAPTSSVDPIKQSIESFANAPTSLQTQAAPRFFDYNAVQADRYVGARNFRSLGFNPTLGQENEYKYGYRQTWGDIWSNGLAGMASLGSNAFIEGWKGWGRMAEAAYSIDASKLMGGAEEREEMARLQNEIFNKYPIYSTPEGQKGILNREFFGNMLQQSGFTLGTAAQMIVEYYLTAGIASAFSGAGKAGAILKGIQTTGELADDTRKVASAMTRSESVIKAIAELPRVMIPLYGTVQDINKIRGAGAGLTQMAMLGLGGIKRELSMFNMARSEAIFESAGTYADLRKRLTDEYIQETGQAPTADIQERIDQKAENASHDNFWTNMGVLSVMNRIQFDNMIKSFNPARKYFADNVTDLAEQTISVTGKVGDKTITQGFLKGRLGSVSALPEIAKTFGKKTAAWEATKMLGKNLTKFEASEGVQELIQEASGEGLNKYYYDLYHGNKGYSSKTDAILSSMKNPLTDDDGMRTFLMGALTGRFIAPINAAVTGVADYKKNKKNREQAKEDLAIVNSFLKDPTNTIYLKEWIANTKVQGKAARTMSEAAAKGNQYVFQNTKNSAFAKAVASAIKLDMYESMRSTMLELGEDLSDKEFTEAFGFDPTKENKKNVKEYMAGVVEKMEDYYNTFNSLKEKYADKIIPELYKNNGDAEYQRAIRAKQVLNDAIEILTTNTVLARQTVVRASGLQQQMASKPSIGSSSNEIVTRIGSEALIKAEIKNLTNEIKEMSNPDYNLTPEQKELLEQKKKDLALVQKFETAYNDIMNEDDVSYYPGVESRAFKAFRELVTFYNTRAKITTPIDPQDVDGAFIEFVDYIRLNRDHASYVDAMNMLANPRDMKIMANAMYASRKYNEEKFVQEAAEELKKKLASPPTDQDKDKDKDKKEGEKEISLMEYLQNVHDGQLENGNTDLSFEDWLKTPAAKTFVNIYNQKYNKNESLEGGDLDKKLRLLQLKKDIEENGVTTENIEKIFDQLSDILGLSKGEVDKRYEAFQETLTEQEVIDGLKALGITENSAEKDVAEAASRLLLPKFIDSLIGEGKPGSKKDDKSEDDQDDDDNAEYDILNLSRRRVVSPAPPKLFEGETLVDSGKDGIFIIKKAGAGNSEFNEAEARAMAGMFGIDPDTFVAQNRPKDTTSYRVVDGQRRDPITLETKNLKLYNTPEEAIKARDEFINKLKQIEKNEFAYFEFAGKQVRKGMVLERKLDGKQFVVISAGAPYQEMDNTGKPKIDPKTGKPVPPALKITMLQNRSLTTSHEIIYDFDRFNIKFKEKKKSSGEYADPNVFRLLRVNELSRIYPHRKMVNGVRESEQDAQKRLDDLYLNNSAEDILNNLTIKIKENKGNRTSKPVAGGAGQKENPSLLQFSDKYQIQILYKGEPIGYLTNYDNLRFQNTSTGAVVPIDKLSVREFNSIFNSQGKDVELQRNLFVENYHASMNVQAELVKFLGADGGEVEISNEDVKKVLGLHLSSGEYDFVAPGSREEGAMLSELPHNKINGYYYILDISRRYSKGLSYKVNESAITNAREGDREKIEREVEEARKTIDPLEQLGRYVAVVRLPNGKVRFVELTTDVIEDSKLSDIITKINERTKVTKENNVIQEKVNDDTRYRAKTFDFNYELNDTISGNLFISVPIQQKGTYVLMSVTDTGNLQLEFFKRVNNETVRRNITLSGQVNGKTLGDPPVFTDINDFLDKINTAIEKHDAGVASEGNKIGFKLTRENFKNSIPDVIDYTTALKLRSKVTKNMVKNIGLSVSYKGKIATAPPAAPVSPVSTTPQADGKDAKPGSAKPPASSGSSELDKAQQELQQLEAERETYRKERIAFYQAAPQNMRLGQAKVEAAKDTENKYNILIEKKHEEINRLRNGKGSALKIVSAPEFTEQSIVAIDKFKKYVRDILGNKVTVQEIDVMIDKLKQNNITVGRFTAYLEQLSLGRKQVKGVIEVGQDAPFKYHEAFHAVFRLMLTDEQIDKYLSYAKMEVKQKGVDVKAEMEKMRKLHVVYKDMTSAELEERFYEEYMADRFDQWKLDKDKKKYLPGLAGFFQKLLDIISEFFKRVTRNELEGLFSDIDRRKYANSKVRENRFTKETALSVNTPVLKAIQVGVQSVQDENGNFVRIPKYLSQEEGEKLASTIASLYYKRAFESNTGVNKNKLLDEIIYDYAELYSLDEGAPRAGFYYDQIEELEKISSEQSDNYLRRLMEMNNIFNSTKNIATLKEAVNLHLTIMGFKQSLEDEEFEQMVDEYGDRVTTDNWKEAHSIGGYGSLSKFLRQYIATTTYELVDGDEFGNRTFVDGTPLIQSVNAMLVYNGILKAVSNISDQGKLVNRLYELKNTNTETGIFLRKFFSDTGLIVDPETRTFEVTNPKQATLFQQVIKGFQQYNVDYLFMNKDIRQSGKKTVVMLANRMGAAKAQFTQWQNAYVSIYEAPLLRIADKEEKNKYIKSQTGFLVDMINDMSPNEFISDEELGNIANQLSDSFKKKLGISLAPIYIKYSIISAKELDKRSTQQQYLADLYSEVTPISRDTIRQLNSSLRTGENPFAKNIDSLKEEINVLDPGERIVVDAEEEDEDIDELGEGGVVSRLNEIAKGNAVFDETVNTTSFKNGEGELVFAHQLPTFHLVAVQDLNDPEKLSQMLDQDYFLLDNALLNNPKFRAMLGNLKVERIESMKSSILEEDEDGNIREDRSIQSNRNKGVVYGSFSDREFLISLLELYGYNKEIKDESGAKFMTSQHLIRVIESSNTGDTVSLPIIRAVETKNDKVELSAEAFDLIFGEVKREIDRIRNVRKEIVQGIYPNGEIEGYHYSVDKNNRRDPNKKGRGVQFYNMKKTLGEDLASKIEEQLFNDPDADISSFAGEISTAIRKYWSNQVEEMLNTMVDLRIIDRVTSTEDGKKSVRYTNNLVGDFIVDGFQKLDKQKKVPDEKKNLQLNLIPGNLKHNIAQILVNDFINTMSFNQLLYGDEAKNFKDSTDQVKRAKGANGSGSSLESTVTAPELGINHNFVQSHILTFTDPKYKANYAGGLKDKADAQSYTTAKGMRYTLHGLGKLTPEVAKVLDKIERGEKLTPAEVKGLKKIESMFNSEKLIYFDGQMYIKTSTVMLTKELTSVFINGTWVARPGYQELHDLRERMEKFELEMERKGNFTVAYAAPKSASKARKTNIYDHNQGFTNADDSNFVKQETKFWRLQLINPSNKVVITDPTQAKQIIISEQDDSLEVNFMGSEKDSNGVAWTVGRIKQMYLQDTAQRVTNNYSRTRDEIFDIDEAYKELGKSLDQDKITPKLAKFQQQALDTLSSTGADSQLLAFFAVDEVTGEPKYNLNNNITLDKYTQLFLAYFSKGVLSEKIPGHSLALMSNYGVKVVKRFTGRYDENGVPIGEVIPRAVVEKNYDTYKNAKTWNNDIDREFSDLQEGEFYIDDLRHNVPEFDKNGKIIGRYTEFVMPAHFEEDLRVMLENGERIPEHMLKAFGVRIPSQAKHSFVSLRLVDFMPGYYGSVGVFPHELIEISGADFDIDKLYMHIVDTYVKKGKRIAYGTSKSAAGKFQEFVAWNFDNNKSFKKEVARRKEIDPSYNDLKDKEKEIKRLGKLLRSVVDTIPESERFIKDSAYNLLMSSRLIDKFIEENFGDYMSEMSSRYDVEFSTIEELGALDDLNDMLENLDARSLQWLERENNILYIENLLKELPSLRSVIKQLAAVEKRIISESLGELKLPTTAKQLSESPVELNNGVLNNRILDQKLLMLTNEHVTTGGSKSIAYEVASLSALSDLLDENVPGNFLDLFKDEKGNLPKDLENILIEGGADTDSLLGKYKAFKNNKEGARNIGPAVNAMLAYAIMNSFDVQFRKTYTTVEIVDGKKVGVKKPMYLFNLDGHTFSGYGNNNSYNAATGKYDGQDRIFNMISTVVSAMTDNAKERLAARLGLNIEAVGYVANMVAQGVPLKTSVMFMLQPVVREYFKEIAVINNNIKTNEESRVSKRKIARNLLKKYKQEVGDDYQKMPLTTDMLVTNIKDNGTSALYQASIMEEFMGLMNQSRYFSLVSQVLKLTKGLGTSFEDYDQIEEAIYTLGLDLKDDNVFEMFSPEGESTPPAFDLRQVLMGYDNGKPYHEFMKAYIRISKQITQLTKSVFLERTQVFKRMEEVIRSNFNVKWNLKEKFNKDLKRDLISYLSIKAYQKYLKDNGKLRTLETMSNGLIYDDIAVEMGADFKDIIDTTRVIREKLPNNYFINFFVNAISTTSYDTNGNIELNKKNRDGVNKLEANTWAKLSEFQIEKLRGSFIDIYQSDVDFDGRNGRDMANTLLNYLIVKDGAQFRSNSFIRYVPDFIFDNLLQSTGRANDIMKKDITARNQETLDEEYKEIFGITSQELFNEFMSFYAVHAGNTPYVQSVLKGDPEFKPTGVKEIDEYDPQSITMVEELNDKPYSQLVYNALGNETAPKGGKVVIDNERGRSASKDGSIIAYRTRSKSEGQTESDYISGLKLDNAIGNPWNSRGYAMYTARSVKESVEEFTAWLLGEKHGDKLQNYRKEILARLDSFKGKPILYYSNIGQPSHATALDYLINKHDWSKEVKPVEEPQVMTKGLSINIFRGINKKKSEESELKETETGVNTSTMTDEEFYEYVSKSSEAEAAPEPETKKDSKAEMSPEDKRARRGKFGKNMELLRARGFRMNDNGEVLFPYVLKMSTKSKQNPYGKDQLFVLKSVKKYNDKKGKLKNKALLIQADESIASGISAYYVPVEREGAPTTFKAGKMFGKLSGKAAKARNRQNLVIANSEEYNAQPDLGTEQTVLIEPKASTIQTSSTSTANVVQTLPEGKTPADILASQFNIQIGFDPAKGGVVYTGDLYNIIPDAIKAGIKSPVQLLEVLGYFKSQSVQVTPVTNFYQAPAEPVTPTVDPKSESLDNEVEGLLSRMSSSSRSSIKDVDMFKELLKQMNQDNPLDDKCATD